MIFQLKRLCDIINHEKMNRNADAENEKKEEEQEEKRNNIRKDIEKCKTGERKIANMLQALRPYF
jgi:hypothetical protein